jgi:phosphatidylinositol alpha 1,6-mannosyltransferase
MRIAIVTESYFPQVNGVSNSVRHVVRRLGERGHEVLVVAPGPGPTCVEGVPVHRARSVDLPRYRTFPLGVPDGRAERAVLAFEPDLVHLASPIVLGAAGLRAAERLDRPAVAVYQTDVGAFARQYGLRLDPLAQRWVARLHRRATRTLVPSTSSRAQLEALRVRDLHLWRRGISLELFGPVRRDEQLRGTWTGGDPAATVIGYVGRLAPEKQVRRLRELVDLPGTRLVVVGDGPDRPWLERHLPGAVFTGMLQGPDLARAFASLDVFVHTGEAETFCQTVQEAQASGVAVVAPAAGGPLDLVDHGRTGLLYAPADPSSLVCSVAALVDDSVGRARMAGAARESVAGRSWARVVDELIDVHYAAVLGHGVVPVDRAA